jgi:DNA invertase Pin-like site-specific DNA recombinase
MLDFAGLMATAQKERWALVALDRAVDTSTPAGEAMAHVLAIFAQFERRLIGQRTKEALAAKKASGVCQVGPAADGSASHSAADAAPARSRRLLARHRRRVVCVNSVRCVGRAYRP